MQPIRILHIVSTLKVGSGVMSVIMNFYRHISREKVQFDFLYFIEDELTHKEEIETLGGKIYFIPKPTIKTLIPYIKAYKEFLNQHAEEYKALHLHEVYLSSLYLSLAHKYGIRHCIIHAHSTKYSDKTINAIRNYFLCLPIKKNADIFFACSEAAGRFLYGDKYVEEGKVRIIHNAIESEKFRYKENIRKVMREELNLDKQFVVGHIGRFSKEKNHEFLINVFAAVKESIPNSVLLLVGEGELLEQVKEQVKQLGIEESVKFLGVRQDVEDVLQAMDVLILPSLFEGLGIVAIEAQASGLPVVASKQVPREIDITSKVKHLSLKMSTTEWGKYIITKIKNIKREDLTQQIKSSHFEITIEAQNLETYYLTL